MRKQCVCWCIDCQDRLELRMKVLRYDLPDRILPPPWQLPSPGKDCQDWASCTRSLRRASTLFPLWWQATLLYPLLITLLPKFYFLFIKFHFPPWTFSFTVNSIINLIINLAIFLIVTSNPTTHTLSNPSKTF